MNTDYLQELQFDKLTFCSSEEDLNLIFDLYGLDYNQIENIKYGVLTYYVF